MDEERQESSVELKPDSSAIVEERTDVTGGILDAPGQSTTIDVAQKAGSPSVPQGSPQYSVDETSIQQQRDKNKMSLKVKLMQRRPVNQLVDQGIMPPPKTPQAHFEQRRHLERARTGDILKTKIEKRPDRQALVQQHILEDTKIAPSLHERQRKLKRAKLADYLNDKIAHRPGPLELVQGNILRLPIAYDCNASKNSSTTSTDDGNGHAEASTSGQGGEAACSAGNETEYSTEEDVSSTASSPTGALSNLKDLQVTSPASVGTSASTSASSESIVPSPASSVSSLPGQAQGTPPVGDRRRANSLVQVESTSLSVSSPASSSQGYPGTLSSLPPSQASQAPSSSTSSSSIRRSKKCRIKMPVLQKTRTIKFHEYKGPTVTPNKNNTQQAPAAVKNNSNEQLSLPATTENNANVNLYGTSYENNLRQQQMFLKMQLESQYRTERRQARLQAMNQQNAIIAATNNEKVLTSTEPPKPSPTASHLTLTFPAQTQQQSQAGSSCNITLASVVPSLVPLMRPVVTATSSALPSSIPPPPPIPLVFHTSLVNTPPTKKVEDDMLKLEVKTEEKPTFKPEDMKVNDLKAELKKRNLPVSGSKTHLLERLRNYLNANPDDKFTFEPKKSPVTSTAESPVEVKRENDVAFPSFSENAISSVSSELETSREPQPHPQLSFLQLDPLQQQQATAIALQTLALAAKGAQQNGSVSHIQNLHIHMDVDHQQQPPRSVAQSTVLNALPTIFLTTQPAPTASGAVQGLTFQSTPIQTNSMPYIITMNGLNSTLNLINGFSGSINGLVQVSNNENLAKPPVVPPSPPSQNVDLQTSMQKLQHFLQQKMKHEDKSNGLSDNSNSSSFSLHQASQVNHVTQNGSGLDPSMMMDEDTNMSGYQNTIQQLQQQSNMEEDGSVAMGDVKKEETSVAPTKYTHRSSFSLTVGGGVKSEAIDDVLEILIRNGELPASAAEDAISKSEILQHNKPLPSISSGAFHDRRLYSLSSSPYQSDEPMPQNSSPSTSSHQNSFCGPLPPISSISPANHGSPVSCLNNNGDSNDTLSSMTCLQSQLAMYNDYLNQSQTITTSPISPADSHEMDVSSAQDTNMWQNQMDYSQTIPNNNNNICWPEQIIQNNNSNMTDEDLSNWLDNLMQNNNFGQDVMPSLTSENLQQCFGSHEPDNFHLENGQTFLQPDLGYQSMDMTDSFFNAASALDPHMFEMLLDDFHDSTGMSGNNGSNGGFLPSFASLNGGNGSSYLYCSEPEQML